MEEYTQQELDRLDEVVDSLPTDVQQMLNAKSTGATASAIAGVIAKRRQAGMSQALTGLVTANVADWDVLDIAAELADGATTGKALRAVRAVITARDNEALGPVGMAFILAALRQYGV